MHDAAPTMPVTITAELYKLGTSFFRQDLASGELPDGRTFEVTTNLYGNGLLFKLEGCGYVHLSLRAVVEALIPVAETITATPLPSTTDPEAQHE